MSAVLSVGLLPPPHQTQAPAPPGELPALPDDGPEEAAGLLHGQEGGQVQVGQEERDHRRGEGGEQGAPPPLAITGAHHHHHHPLSEPECQSPAGQQYKGIALYLPFIRHQPSAFYLPKTEYLESRSSSWVRA